MRSKYNRIMLVLLVLLSLYSVAAMVWALKYRSDRSSSSSDFRTIYLRK